jgi:hypothetical protein
MYLFVTGKDKINAAGTKYRPFGVDLKTGRSFVNSGGSDSEIPGDSNDSTAANTKWVTENFFPRSGGKLRGTIMTYPDFFNGADKTLFQNLDDSHPLWIRGGTSDNASGLILAGADVKVRPGAFTLRAGTYKTNYDKNNPEIATTEGISADLIGTANGDLYWQGFYIDLGYPAYRTPITVTLSEVDGVWSATIPQRCWIMLSFQVFNKISNTDVRINGGLAARFFPNSEVLNPCLMLPVRAGDKITINHIYNQQYTCLLLPFVTYSKEVSE